MSYTPNIWVDREGTTRYFETIDTDGAKIFTPDYSQLTEIGTPVNADHMNHIEEGISDNDKRITVLEEETDPKQFLNKTQITNCITEIPQDIKLELNNGVLTLKAGSKVYVPNGFEADGTTPKFDEVTIDGDYSMSTDTGTPDGQHIVYIGLTETKLHHRVLAQAKSGTTEPTNGTYYNTATNIITAHNAAGDMQVSLPVGIISFANGEIISIDQVFNGFGYIGSTVFVTKGVKGLIPNGRNEDGSLRNIEFTTSKLFTLTQYGDNNSYNYSIELSNNDSIVNQDVIVYDTNNVYFVQATRPNVIRAKWFDTSSNQYYFWDNNHENTELRTLYKVKDCSFATVTFTNNTITSLTPKLPFRAIDYFDKSEVSSWGMPSGRLVTLTLGATNTTYTAPANGYFCLIMFIRWNANEHRGAYIQRGSFTTGCMGKVAAEGNDEIRLICPASKGQAVTVNYAYTGTYADSIFTFHYAEGEV